MILKLMVCSRVPAAAFDLCMFILAAYKGIRQYKSGAMKASRLMQVLFRDSFIYYCL